MRLRTFIVLLVVMTACTNANKRSKVVFNPQKSETETEVDVYASQATEECVYSQRVKLTIMLPSELALSNQMLLKSKLLQIVTKGGIGGFGGDPIIIFAPIFSLLSEGVTATIPAKKVLKYNVTFYVANTLSGDVYGTASIDVMGVGESSELALQNAINSLSSHDPAIYKMLKSSEEKIVGYYSQNGDRIIASAQNRINNNQYDVAIAMLNSIPMECGQIYDKAQNVLAPIYKKNVEIYAEKAFSQMKTCLVETDVESRQKAILFYQQIPTDSSIKAQADMLLDSYTIKLNETEQIKLENERNRIEKEFNHQKEMELLKLRMSASANDKLIESYQKDLAYEKLPWLRKLVHFGDLDPFDGTNDLKWRDKVYE